MVDHNHGIGLPNWPINDEQLPSTFSLQSGMTHSLNCYWSISSTPTHSLTSLLPADEDRENHKKATKSMLEQNFFCKWIILDNRRTVFGLERTQMFIRKGSKDRTKFFLISRLYTVQLLQNSGSNNFSKGCFQFLIFKSVINQSLIVGNIGIMIIKLRQCGIDGNSHIVFYF